MNLFKMIGIVAAIIVCSTACDGSVPESDSATSTIQLEAATAPGVGQGADEMPLEQARKACIEQVDRLAACEGSPFEDESIQEMKQACSDEADPEALAGVNRCFETWKCGGMPPSCAIFNEDPVCETDDDCYGLRVCKDQKCDFYERCVVPQYLTSKSTGDAAIGAEVLSAAECESGYALRRIVFNSADKVLAGEERENPPMLCVPRQECMGNGGEVASCGEGTTCHLTEAVGDGSKRWTCVPFDVQYCPR